MSLCYDFEKWTMITLASVAISLTVGLVSLTYGANSLEELRNHVENPVIDTYRQELINYITEHNVTLYDFPISNFNNTALELFVQADMMACKDWKEKGIPFDPRCAPVTRELADILNSIKAGQ